jgi:hypothetical protein
MTNSTAAKTPRPSSPVPDASLPARALKSLRKWTMMNEPARLLGRGLSRRELMARAARDIGATTRQVESALKDSQP